MVAPGSGWSLPQVAFTFRHHVTPDLARIDCTATCVPGLFVKSTNKHQTDLLHIAATSSSCYICSLVSSSPSWCRQSLWNCGRCRFVRTRDSEVVSCDWKKKSKIKLQFSPAPVLPVVVFVVEGASFEYLKVSRPKNGIVDNRSVLEPRRLREALVVRVWFLLVAGGVPILLRELLTAGLVLKIQLYCLVTTFWVPFIWQPSPTNLDKAQGQCSCPFINSVSFHIFLLW